MGSKRMSRISLKIVLWFVILGALLCLCTSITGYFQYNSSMRKLYNATAYAIAETALSYTSADELSRLAALARGYSEGRISDEAIKEEVATPRYQALREQMRSLREAMGANDVVIFCIDLEELDNYSVAKQDWSPILYIADCYAVQGLSYTLGDRGAFNPKYKDELSRIARAGERVESLFVSNGDYGYNTSALLPVPAGDDVVIIAAEMPMRTLTSALRGYIMGALAVTVAVVAVIIVLFYFGFEKMFVAPIRRMADAVSGFISGDADSAITSSISTLDVKTNDELGVLCDSLKQMERDIITYMGNLQSTTAEREHISAELDVARQIQTSILPCIFPAFPEREEFDIYAVMTPAKEVGGDFYDFFMVDERHLAIVIADVSGKGVPAALFMVIAKTLIKNHTLPGSSLDTMFEEVNELLCEANSEALFVTAFEGILDLKTGRLCYVNAGHEMPFLCVDGRFEAKKIKPGFVLASMKGIKYEMGEFTLKPGDKIFQYTDGIPEAMTSAREPYGMERLEEALNRCTNSSPQEIIAAVKEDVDAFARGTPQFDDITMLCLEYKKRLVKG